ncbi:hypothetical protein pdam_00025427 [Pocillopora damicornis]|uniref:Uncharacterized protein n=1 Tax=Pocillopora damicornis TaxID=46731 RepID=A0A3M6UD67_POCDA|nr:hypothetical protein pdam_00025427 [Pocillopora damicornis]
MEQVEKMSTSQLIAEQHGDPEVSPIFSRCVSESEVSQSPTCYFMKNGMPIKMWRPPDVPTEEEWAVQTLAQVDDFSENTTVSLSNRDCEAPVPVKILIGMELDVSVDNDTEPSWVKG